MLWLEGRCLELGMTASYWLFVDLFREYFGWGPEEDDRARGERIVAALRELADRKELTAERVEEIGPLLGNLLSVRFGTDWDERLKNAGPEQIRHQTFTAVRDFFVAIARIRPVLLACEDLHWADSLSLDLISLLMEALTLAPILLLCVYRPEREHKCWRLRSLAAQKCAGRYTEVELRELTPSQSRHLVESLLAIDNLPDTVKEMILEKSRGNPFFVEEVIRSLIDSGMVYREADTWRARPEIESMAVPESVQSVILSRVDRLERALRGVLESASVIGRLFRRRLLEHTTRESESLERALLELEDRQLIYQERVVPEEEYSFKHVLTQETIYQSILRRRRAVFHQKVAEAMEALYPDGLEEYYEQLAYHYERTETDEKAAEYLLKAGEKARRAYHNEEAIRYLERALERLDRWPDSAARQEWRMEALKGLGDVYHGLGKVAEGEQYYRQAIAVGEQFGRSPRELARLHAQLNDTLWWLGRFDDMIDHGEAVLAQLGDDRESVEAILVKDGIALGRGNKSGYSDTMRQFANENAPLLRRLPYSEEQRPAYVHIFEAFAYGEKNVEKAMEWLRDFEAKARQHHHLTALGDIHRYTGSCLTRTGDLHRSISSSQQGLELYESIGDAKHASGCLGNLAEAFLSLGDLQKAEEYTRQGLEISEAVGHKSWIAFCHARLGRIALCRGSWQDALDAYGTACQLFKELGNPGFAREITLLTLGRAYLAQANLEAAAREFEASADQAKSSPVLLAGVLSGLEESCDDSKRFRAACRRIREAGGEGAGRHRLQWFLDPAHPQSFPQAPWQDEFVASVAADWTWHDPFGDCTFTVRNGLEIHAANGRGLWGLNLSAPRLLRPISGDFAAETVCVPAVGERPVIGGILLWKDRENFLRLDRGAGGAHEISFSGCLDNEDTILGRGRLPSARVFLRLERAGRCVRALCSADGEEWFTVGDTEFAQEDPIELGLHAIGQIERTIYHDAYPEGTAIRFEGFQLWTHREG